MKIKGSVNFKSKFKFNEELLLKYNSEVNMPTEERKSDLRKDNKVIISWVNNGYIVEVGCQMFVFSCEKDLVEALKLFYNDPEKAKEKYVYTKKCGIVDNITFTNPPHGRLISTD